MKPISTLNHLNLLTIFRNYGTLLHNASIKHRDHPTLQYEFETWVRCNERLKTHSSLRLANSLLICIHQKEILKFFGKRPASAKGHFEEKYPEHAKGAFYPTEELEELLHKLKMMANNAQKSSWVSRVSVEANEANDAGWYMIFDTLSVLSLIHISEPTRPY